MGYQGSDKVNEYFSHSSLYVMTSFTESFGLVLLESFSHGVPAIAFDSAQGATELINGRNGILVSKRNKENMAEFIDRYFHNEDLKKKMSQESLKTSKEYLESNVINKWLDIIN